MQSLSIPKHTKPNKWNGMSNLIRMSMENSMESGIVIAEEISKEIVIRGLCVSQYSISKMGGRSAKEIISHGINPVVKTSTTLAFSA